MNRDSSTGIILKRFTGFLMFLVVLLAANILVSFLRSPVYTNIIIFFNSIIVLFLILFLVGMLNDVLWNSGFPFALLAPISGAVLSIFIVAFFYRLWEFIDSYVNSGAAIPIGLIYALVFLFVLAGGYFSLLFKSAKRGDNFGDWNEWKRNWHEERTKLRREMRESMRKMKHEGKSEGEVEWKDIGNEFKLALYNAGRSLNRAFRHDEGKKRRKR